MKRTNDNGLDRDMTETETWTYCRRSSRPTVVVRWHTEIVVALVGGGFAVVVALISKIGHDNKKDHGIVHQSLGSNRTEN
jgi:hypothetical protein